MMNKPSSDDLLPPLAREIKHQVQQLLGRGGQSWQFEDLAIKLLHDSLSVTAPHPSLRSSPNSRAQNIPLSVVDHKYDLDSREVHPEKITSDGSFSALASLNLLGRYQVINPKVQEVLLEVERVTYSKNEWPASNFVEYCLPKWFDFQSSSKDVHKRLNRNLSRIANRIDSGYPEVEILWQATANTAPNLLLLAASLCMSQELPNTQQAAECLAAASCLVPSVRGLADDREGRLTLLGQSLTGLFLSRGVVRTASHKPEVLAVAIPDFGGPA